MVRRQQTSAASALVDGKPAYQCVLVADQWHLTQEQASPPSIVVGGAWTLCGPWAEFKRGFERRRPTCTVCMAEVAAHEARQAARAAEEI